jgi:type I restriction enzyme S subunit
MSLMRIDEIFSFEKGVLQSTKCVPGEYDFITASSDWKTHNEYTHDCEALIFAAAASGSLGRTHYVNGKFVSSDLCFIITPKDQENLPVDLKFYHILFNELKDEIVRNTKAGTSKEAIGLGSFGRYELPYFDIETQIEIKNHFVKSEEIKSSITNELNQQIDLVKNLRQQLLQDAVQGKLVEQNKKDEPANKLLTKIKAEKEKLIDEKKLKKEKELAPIDTTEISFEIPDNWVLCRLGDISTLITDGKHGDAIAQPNSGYYFLSAKDVQNGKLQYDNARQITYEDFFETHRRTNLEAGDLCIVNTGATIGKTALVDNSELTPKTTFQKSVAVIKVLNQFTNMKYVEYFMINETPKLLKTSKGSAINNLLLGDMKNVLFPMPPLSEQSRIVQKLDELMQYCNKLEASIKQSESQNEKLLQQVLREALRKEPVEA